jgi:hypothetical protein
MQNGVITKSAKADKNGNPPFSEKMGFASEKGTMWFYPPTFFLSFRNLVLARDKQHTKTK